MNTLTQKTICTFSALLIFLTSFAADIHYTYWKFNSLTTIGGIAVTPEGNPTLIPINNDTAYLFDGTGDRVVINDNPLIGLDEFTFEVVFRVDRGGVDEQKFIHMQASPDIRILFELQFLNDSMWYMDSFIKSANGESMNFIDSTQLFAADRWYHAALVYKNNEFKRYINYTTTNTGTLTWVAPTDGSISVGARMNSLNYMTGAVREIRFADAALDSTQFLFYGELLEQHETFVLDNLVEINGHTVQSFGKPEVVETEIGYGIDFDGTEDGIYILTNPIGSTKYFTIETIIKPNDVYPANAEPRYLHIEDGDNVNRRITMELRLNDSYEWYFDGYLKAESVSIGLMDETLTHPVDGWEHLAITYDNGIFKTYVNYSMEMDTNWGPHFLPLGDNTKMSLGMRMNQVNYFNGIIQRIRVTKAVLDTSEFMAIYDTSGGTGSFNSFAMKADLHVDVFPNPANSNTHIRLMATSAGNVTIALYNIAGIKVGELYNGYISEGITEAGFDAALYPKGIYILQIRYNQQIETKKILIQ
ncbi:MAG: T9SS type A sorting domain-containing protein [Bacteroidales bacterium]|nr:T9SS type A sorting domain-containing protein [Bacteroidales bacterium]